MKKNLRLIFSLMPFMPVPSVRADATTSVTVIKLALDGTTVLNNITVTLDQMMAGSAGLPIYGDGVTHYYFQGPTFNASNMWDPEEMFNIDSRDYGACKGTNVKDLCQLAGGASPGDEIKVKASDGFSKMFAYEDVYTPEPEQGKLILTWYTKDAEEGLSGERYVSDGSYNTGMRLIFFAETLNPEGKHVFGSWDMHECLAEKYWHYYYDGTYWPSSSGLSVKWVSDIIIYSSEEPQPSPTPTPTSSSTTSPTPTPQTTSAPSATPSSTAASSPELTPTPEIPEFPWGIILPLLMTGTLISLVIYRKNATIKRKITNS